MAVLAAIEKPTAFLDREGDGFNPILAICCFCSSSYLVLSFWGDCCHIQRASGHRWYPGRYRMQELPTVPNVLDGDLPLWWPEYSGLCVLNPSFRSLVPPSPSMSPTLPQLLLASVLAGVTSHFPQTQLGLLTVAWCPPGEAMLFSCQQLLLCFFLPFCRIIATFNKCLKDEDWY